MLLGLLGLGVLLAPHTGGSIALVPAVVAVLASVAWSVGSIYQRRMGTPKSLVLATALQMLGGGALLAIEAALTGEWSHVDLHTVSLASASAFAWLVVLGSVVSYSAYLYTMQAASTSLASTYAFVNPLVSLVLGFLLFGERLTTVEALASAIILAGVALMMLPRKSQPA
jgi:drug/metabolite transporter (DMT)-like permease